LPGASKEFMIEAGHITEFGIGIGIGIGIRASGC